MILRLGIRSGSLPAALVLATAAFAAGGIAGSRLRSVAPEPAATGPVGGSTLPASRAPGGGPSTAMVYPAEVLRVIDGDTFEARVRIWPGLEVTTKVRLLGVDAPELRAKCAEEERLAETARDTLAELLAKGEVGLHAVRLDKYGGRVLASARTQSITDVGAALLNAGVARPYQGGRREGWCS